MSRHLHLGAWLCHGARSLSKAVLQAQDPALDALYNLLAGNVEVERDLGREKQRVSMAISSQLEVNDTLNHALVDHAEPSIRLYLLIVLSAMDRAVTEVKLEAEHVLSLPHAANLRHLITQGQLVVLCWSNVARFVSCLCLRHELEAGAALLGELRAYL